MPHNILDFSTFWLWLFFSMVQYDDFIRQILILWQRKWFIDALSIFSFLPSYFLVFYILYSTSLNPSLYFYFSPSNSSLLYLSLSLGITLSLYLLFFLSLFCSLLVFIYFPYLSFSLFLLLLILLTNTPKLWTPLMTQSLYMSKQNKQ